MLTLSKKHNISDVGLRNVCHHMGVPLPNSGFWAKVQHGQTPAIKTLPSDHYGQKEITLYVFAEEKSAIALIKSEQLAIICIKVELDYNTS